MWRYRLLALMPFLGKWIEVAPAACCGMCPTCITTAAGSLLLPMLGEKRNGDDAG